MNEKEVIKKIGKNRWKEFCEFMVGQTVSCYPNGETNYYECDVDNFMRKKENRFYD